MNLEFFVKDKRITRKGFQPVVADTSGHYTFTLDFDREWDGLVKVVVFQNGAETAQLIYTGRTWLPDQVSKRGDLYVACHGYKTLGDTVAVLRTVRMTRPVRILESGRKAGEDPAQYTPTVFEQVMGAVGAANGAAQEARSARAELLDARERGMLDGQAATVTVGTVETGEAGTDASVVNGGTASAAVLNFVIPRGPAGPQGDTGPAGPQGPMGTSLTVLGRCDTLAALQAAHPVGTAGQAYAVGTESSNVVYVWSDDSGAWVSLGPLQGARGPAGADGRGVASVTYDGGTDLWTVTFTDGEVQTVAGPEIPSLLSDLTSDSGHRTVTDEEKAVWSGKSDFSGSYDSLTDIPYATCSTEQATAAKTAACTGNFTLKTGAMVWVKFSYTNTVSSPTLNVNGTGAKSIMKYGTTAVSGYMWYAGAVVLFVYDGTNWILAGGNLATTAYYGVTKLSTSTSSTSTAMAATPSAVKAAYDLANAAMPKTGGTFTGAVCAMSGTGTAAQLRNTALYAAETDPTVNGQINWTYE